MMSNPSMSMPPLEISVKRNKLNARLLFPAPVLPTIPTLSHGLTSKLTLLSTSGPSLEYLTERLVTLIQPSIVILAYNSL